MAIDLETLRGMDGFIGAAVVDSESAMCLATIGGGPELDLEVAGAANCEVVKAKRKAIDMLKLNDKIEDILISLEHQYHLIRPIDAKPGVFIYVALRRAKANLGLARAELRNFEKGMKLAA